MTANAKSYLKSNCTLSAQRFRILIKTEHNAPRFLRSSSPAHRVFATRRRGSDARADEKGEGIQHAGRGDDGPRRSLRRDRILPGGEARRHQADHWLRG